MKIEFISQRRETLLLALTSCFYSYNSYSDQSDEVQDYGKKFSASKKKANSKSTVFVILLMIYIV